MAYPEHLIQVQPRDLGPYKDGGTGIDYVHTFDSGVDGPHVMINSINKGNEICGSEAVATLLPCLPVWALMACKGSNSRTR